MRTAYTAYFCMSNCKKGYTVDCGLVKGADQSQRAFCAKEERVCHKAHGRVLEWWEGAKYRSARRDPCAAKPGFPVDCDYVDNAVREQLPFCTKREADCRQLESLRLGHRERYRTRKPGGSARSVSRAYRERKAQERAHERRRQLDTARREAIIRRWRRAMLLLRCVRAFRDALDRAHRRGYPRRWPPCLPGDPRFNATCDALMRRYVVARDSRFEATCFNDAVARNKNHIDYGRTRFPHQRVFRWMVHPCTPITRVLAVHMVGAGKTRMIIDGLGNYVLDPRAKIVVFPKASQADNFYKELMDYEEDNPMRDAVISELGGGSYAADLLLTMSGYWEVELTVDADAGIDTATIGFDVE